MKLRSDCFVIKFIKKTNDNYKIINNIYEIFIYFLPFLGLFELINAIDNNCKTAFDTTIYTSRCKCFRIKQCQNELNKKAAYLLCMRLFLFEGSIIKPPSASYIGSVHV